MQKDTNDSGVPNGDPVLFPLILSDVLPCNYQISLVVSHKLCYISVCLLHNCDTNLAVAFSGSKSYEKVQGVK